MLIFLQNTGRRLLCGCVLNDIKWIVMLSTFLLIMEGKTINELMINNEKRIKFAKAGNELMKQYTWENAYKHFSDLLN